jgi:diguanylate cyclase (GGDEF)-like protein/PAS domain S-box-containing protein
MIPSPLWHFRAHFTSCASGDIMVEWSFSDEREALAINPKVPKLRKTQSADLQTGLGFYKVLLDNISDGVYFVDRERCIRYWNKAAERLTGYSSAEIVGRFCNDDILCHVDAAGCNLCKEGCPLTASIADGEMHQAHVFLRHKKGRRVPVFVRIQPIRGENGKIIGAVEIFSDDSIRHGAQRKTEAMARLALLDPLTQLPNRRFLEMSLCTAWSEYNVHHDPFGVLLIDLDYFKRLNDTYGHISGDRALQEVAKTLTGTLRPTDIVGRWGGDEFLAIVRNVDSTTLKELAMRCVCMVAKTVVLSSEDPVFLSVSVGGALAQPDGSTEHMILCADERMYRSKADGRDRATTD